MSYGLEFGDDDCGWSFGIGYGFFGGFAGGCVVGWLAGEEFFHQALGPAFVFFFGDDFGDRCEWAVDGVELDFVDLFDLFSLFGGVRLAGKVG